MSLIEHINLTDGFNINPISLEFGNEMTSTKFLYSLQSKINKFIDDCNGVLGQANNYTDEKVKTLNDLFEKLQEEILNGDIIKDGSVSLKKLNDAFLKDLQSMVIDYIKDLGKFVWFGLDDTGHFIAIIPSSWDEINFSTDSSGRLCLSLSETKRSD